MTIKSVSEKTRATPLSIEAASVLIGTAAVSSALIGLGIVSFLKTTEPHEAPPVTVRPEPPPARALPALHADPKNVSQRQGEVASLCESAKVNGRVALNWTDVSRQDLLQIARAPQVCQLNFDRSDIDNKSLSVLSSLPKLFSISLSHTNFNDEGAKEILACSKLSVMEASNSNLTDRGLATLATWKSLKALELSGPSEQFTDRGIASLSQSQLADLSLRYLPSLTDKAFAGLEDSNILRLGLTGLDIRSKGYAEIARMKRLKWVNLSHSAVTAEEIRQLARSKSIQEIGLHRCSAVNPSDLQKLRKELPHLKIALKAEE